MPSCQLGLNAYTSGLILFHVSRGYCRTCIQYGMAGSDLNRSATHHRNNFGFLRLAFAALVVLGHSFDLVTVPHLAPRIGTISSGGLAVDGFFLISGYLITMSGEQSSTYRGYLTKRVLRIYPGYVVAYLVSVLIVGPLAGGDISTVIGFDGLAHVFRIFLLRTPYLANAFHGLPFAILDQPIWTIAYEFRCYLLVVVLAATGVLDKPRAYLALTAGALVLSVVVPGAALPTKAVDILGNPRLDIHFIAVFLCGGMFYLFRDRILYSGYAALAAMLCLLPLTLLRPVAEPALAVLGGYALFWFALKVKSGAIARVGSNIDLSYGIYLYGWPVQNLIIWYDRDISPWPLFGLSITITPILALVSWTLIERPCLRLKHRASRTAWTLRPAE